MGAICPANEPADKASRGQKARKQALKPLFQLYLLFLAATEKRREGRTFLLWRHSRRIVLLGMSGRIAPVARRLGRRLRLGARSRLLLVGAHGKPLAVEHRGLASSLAL